MKIHDNEKDTYFKSNMNISFSGFVQNRNNL